VLALFRQQRRGGQVMTVDHFQRFADDLRALLGLAVEFQPDSDPQGLHILHINGVDFHFYANGTGYDGWGKCIVPKRRRRKR